MANERWLLTIIAVLCLFIIVPTSARGVPINSIKKGVKRQLGVEEDLYDVISTTYQGEDVTLILVLVNERTLNSKLDPEIKSAMRDYIGQNALFISAMSTAEKTNFYPHAIRIYQKGDKFRVASVEGLTANFRQGEMPETMTAMGQKLWGSKGIVTFPDQVDASNSFSVNYGSTSAKFAPLRPERPETIREPSQKSTEDTIAKGEGRVDSSGKSQSKEPGQAPTVERERTPRERTPRRAPRTGNAAQQGMFLLTSFVNLLLVSLTFLM